MVMGRVGQLPTAALTSTSSTNRLSGSRMAPCRMMTAALKLSAEKKTVPTLWGRIGVEKGKGSLCVARFHAKRSSA